MNKNKDKILDHAKQLSKIDGLTVTVSYRTEGAELVEDWQMQNEFPTFRICGKSKLITTITIIEDLE